MENWPLAVAASLPSFQISDSSVATLRPLFTTFVLQVMVPLVTPLK